MTRARFKVAKLIQGSPVQGNAVQAKKLLLSKWTAVAHVGKEKHFLVTKLHRPDGPDVPDVPDGPDGPQPPEGKLEWVDIEAVFSKASRRIAWRELKDASKWQRGWV